jgi:hypothetical protein
MVDTLALHEELALYSLTKKELEAIKNKLENLFPKEEFAEIYKIVWQRHAETGALQIHRLIIAKYPGYFNERRRAMTWFHLVKQLPHRLRCSCQETSENLDVLEKL